VVVELGEKDFSAGLSYVAIFQVKTLQGLAFHTHFNHAHLKKPKETDSMLMLNKDNECCNQLRFQLNMYGTWRTMVAISSLHISFRIF